MATLTIHDTKNRVLAFDLYDLLQLLAPRSLQATWTVSMVQEEFEATGAGGEKLEALARKNARVSGVELTALASDTRQVIWGEFIGSFPTGPSLADWLVIRAVDSSWYEISTSDETVLRKVESTFQDVRPGYR